MAALTTHPPTPTHSFATLNDPILCCVIPRSQIIRQLEGSTYVLNSDACTEQEWAQLEAAYDVIARPKYRSATVTARGMVRAVFLLGEQTPGRGAASHPQYATRRALGVG